MCRRGRNQPLCPVTNLGFLARGLFWSRIRAGFICLLGETCTGVDSVWGDHDYATPTHLALERGRVYITL